MPDAINHDDVLQDVFHNAFSYFIGFFTNLHIQLLPNKGRRRGYSMSHIQTTGCSHMHLLCIGLDSSTLKGSDHMVLEEINISITRLKNESAVVDKIAGSPVSYKNVYGFEKKFLKVKKKSYFNPLTNA